jgi:hypothetical protein
MNPDGTPNGPALNHDNHTGKTSPLLDPDGKPIGTKSAIGAVQNTKDARNNARTIGTLDSLTDEINDADAKGLLGPGSGTVENLMARKYGTTGNPDNDRLLASLATDLNMARMQTDYTVTGTTRGAASPQLSKTWNDLLSTKLSKAGLLGTIASIRRVVSTDSGTAPKAGAPTKIGGFVVTPVTP